MPSSNDTDPHSENQMTYQIEVECKNCDTEGVATITKGTVVPEKIECPNCGCVTATKKNPKTWTEPFRVDSTRRKPSIRDYLPPHIWTNDQTEPYREPVRRTFPRDPTLLDSWGDWGIVEQIRSEEEQYPFRN